MNSRIVIFCLTIIMFSSTVFATGKSISGEFPKGNQIIDGVQYINKGTQPFDLDQASVIAEIDPSDHSVTLTIPSIAPPESLYIRFIPSNLFSATLSTEVTWNAPSETYKYKYTIISDQGSITPIRYFDIEWWNDYKRLYKPEGWSAKSIHSRRVNIWSTYADETIHGGDSLSGLGYESYGPPHLTEFEIWGDMKTLHQRGDNEWFGSIYSGIATKYRGVKGITIAAWVSPESIEPVNWFGNICFKMPILVSAGFIQKDIEKSIYPILYDLWETFQTKENHSIDKLEQKINDVLSALEPYYNQMETEAQAYIFENLKYVLRHTDIVTFKEYP